MSFPQSGGRPNPFGGQPQGRLPQGGQGWSGQPGPIGGPGQPAGGTGLPGAPGWPAAGLTAGATVGAYSSQPLPGTLKAGESPSLPIDDREYHEFYRAPRWSWWRGLVAIAVFAIVWFLLQLILMFITMVIDGINGNEPATPEHMTPTGFLSNNVGVALALPVAFLTQWLVVGQRPRWLSSVAGGFRWTWFGTCLAICAPLWIALNGWEAWMSRSALDLAVNPSTWLLVFGILLTTPFQAAAEEYSIRGLLARCVAGWIPHRLAGLIVATVVSGIVFTLLHMAQDPWLNVFYFGFGVMAALITWRTGGLEAAVAIHVVNNLTSEWIVPFSDISDMFNRESGRGDWTILLSLAIIALAWGLIELAARKVKPQRVGAPGLVHQQLASTSSQFPGMPTSQPGGPWAPGPSLR